MGEYMDEDTLNETIGDIKKELEAWMKKTEAIIEE